MDTATADVAGDVLLLVGNPNVGKSALFSHLTGKYVTVSNYPGTTVDLTRGRHRRDARDYEVVDTPGVYSLHPQSEDELVTRDLLLANPHAVVILVLDAKNLARGLLLAQQLGELGAPFCVALNMADEALSQGLRIDEAALAEALGVPVVPTVATSGRGVEALAAAIPTARPGRFRGVFPAEIETALDRLAEVLAEATGAPSARLLALAALQEPASLPAPLREALGPGGLARLEAIAAPLRRLYNVPLAGALTSARLGGVGALVRQVQNREAGGPGGLASRLGTLAVHPVGGLFAALAVLLVVYEFVGVFGAGVLVGWLENGLFGRVLNPLLAAAAGRFVPWAWLRDFLVGEYGLFTMALTYSLAIILPVVGTFFIAFGVLEDSGYMPRLAVMANRFFRRMGLHGKAVLPMILGLGCDTMATLTARIMETRKERILVTLLLALGVPCSAQLGVILGMLGTVSFVGVLIWVGVVTVVMMATGAIAARILPGAGSDFILELPPMRVPGMRNILIKTGARIEWYLKEAVPLFVLGTILLFALDRLHLLVAIRNAAAPVVQALLGLPERATDAFLIGFLRRDYGAAGLYDLQRQGLMDGRQVVVSLVVITLFVPCIANFFVMVKERGLRTGLAIAGVVMVIALGVGGALNWSLRLLGVDP